MICKQCEEKEAIDNGFGLCENCFFQLEFLNPKDMKQQVIDGLVDCAEMCKEHEVSDSECNCLLNSLYRHIMRCSKMVEML